MAAGTQRSAGTAQPSQDRAPGPAVRPIAAKGTTRRAANTIANVIGAPAATVVSVLISLRAGLWSGSSHPARIEKGRLVAGPGWKRPARMVPS